MMSRRRSAMPRPRSRGFSGRPKISVRWWRRVIRWWRDLRRGRCWTCARGGWGREGVGVNPDILGAVGFDDRGIGFDPARADQIKAVGNGGEDSLKAGADGVGAAWKGDDQSAAPPPCALA